ncbi:MAG TPA: protein kinase [Bacteroidota bacterium]|jgi:serine/threonine protein kinase/Tfp pilus assembly protein PilF|nr:protein kinase [Bacteroidota bacterium]
MIGQTISHYKILEKLGEGGMGVVYKAEDLKLKRTVAIKFLPKRLSVHGEERERFALEAQAASSLNHPNICVIHEIDEVNDETFMVMEYVEGSTLREWIHQKSDQADGYRKLAMKEITDLVSQIAEGLEKAHEKGIVHRDIKSENIMVTGDGRAKIMDFGLAKLRGVSKLTKTGSTIGTVAYMSPEQVEGIETDHRTDIFSFGVVLYEMLTGQLPFRAAHETAMMYEIINVEPKPATEARQSVDGELNRIVMKCLEKNREERYQSMRDVVVDLKRYRRDSSGRSIDRSTVREALPQQQASAGAKSRLPVVVGLVVAISLLGAVAWYIFGSRTSAIDSLAVLPFANVTTDPNAEYLTEGITENITNKLSQLSKLRVIPRSMVAKYKGKEVDPRDVGKDLNVSAVLTGKVTQRGDALVIQTELIDIHNVSQLWGEQYNKSLSDIIIVQQDIVQKVAEKLQTQVSGEERKILTAQHAANPEAYQLYLKGHFQSNKRSVEGYRKALEYFEHATSIDPNFALAYYGVAEAYIVGLTLDLSTKEYMPKVKANTLKALELDAGLAEAHASLAVVRGYYDFDYAGAEQSFRRAIELNPNYPTAHHWFAEFLVYMGRFDEGLAEYRRATELDPASLVIASDFGLAYFFMRQYDQSIEFLKKTIDMDPNFVRSHFYIMQPYLKKGMKDEAFKELINGMVANGDSANRIGEVKKLYLASGFKGLAQFNLERAARDSNVVISGVLLSDLLRVGDKNKALTYLEQAYEERDNYCVTMKIDPLWDDLRNEPRFIALMKKMGFEK